MTMLRFGPSMSSGSTSSKYAVLTVCRGERVRGRDCQNAHPLPVAWDRSTARPGGVLHRGSLDRARRQIGAHRDVRWRRRCCTGVPVWTGGLPIWTGPPHAAPWTCWTVQDMVQAIM